MGCQYAPHGRCTGLCAALLCNVARIIGLSMLAPKNSMLCLLNFAFAHVVQVDPHHFRVAYPSSRFYQVDVQALADVVLFEAV